MAESARSLEFVIYILAPDPTRLTKYNYCVFSTPNIQYRSITNPSSNSLYNFKTQADVELLPTTCKGGHGWSEFDLSRASAHEEAQ